MSGKVFVAGCTVISAVTVDSMHSNVWEAAYRSGRDGLYGSECHRRHDCHKMEFDEGIAFRCLYDWSHSRSDTHACLD